MDTQKFPFPLAFLGATGAVGNEALKTLINESPKWEMRVFGRRALPGKNTGNIQEFTGDLFDQSLYARRLEWCRAAICTLGMGQPSKASPEEFHRIDFDAVILFARACFSAGVTSFSLLTAVGADTLSRVRYLRIKWELEEAIGSLGFQSVRIFQPSMIITPENRYGVTQYLTLKLYPFIDPLLAWLLKPFRSIKVKDLGCAMALDCLSLDTQKESGIKRFTWAWFRKILRK